MGISRICAAAPAAVLLLVANFALAGPPVAVSECGTVITEPGKYRVTQDLFCAPGQNGIWVLASDVTIDLRGHTITCDASGDELVAAVLIGDYPDPAFVFDNVRVKKGTVSGCDDGLVFFNTRSGKVTQMLLSGNPGGGITLLDAQGTIVKNNVGTGNITAIRSFGGIDNQFKGNWLFDNSDAAIRIVGETDSTVACNTSDWNVIGISVGEASSGNMVRGNLVTNTAVAGITLYGVGTPDEIFEPVPFGNLIKHNIVQASGQVDLSELVFDRVTGGVFVHANAQCQNTWRKNQFVTEFGPIDCFGVPVELDDEDVCAIDEDGDEDDS